MILINKDDTHLTKQYCMVTTNFNDYSIKKVFYPDFLIKIVDDNLKLFNFRKYKCYKLAI